MANLTLAQRFFRYFSNIQAFVATTMILGGLWMRLTTGWHAASFLFFVFGLTCVYLSITSLFAWKNWFLEGPPDPALEKKRRRSIVTYLALGGLVWAFFGLALIVPGTSRVNVYEFDIKRTPQFDRELQRFFRTAKVEGDDPIEEYTDSKLRIQGEGAGAVAALRMHSEFYKDLTANSHIHIVDVGGERYEMTLLSHQFHFGWSDNEMEFGINSLKGDFCQLFVPFSLETLDAGMVEKDKVEGLKPVFVENPELNTLDFVLSNGELIVSHFLTSGNDRRVEACKKGAYEYLNTGKITSLGTVSLISAPDNVVRYIAFPGFNDGVLKAGISESRVFKSDFSSYIDQVGRVSRRIFD